MRGRAAALAGMAVLVAVVSGCSAEAAPDDDAPTQSAPPETGQTPEPAATSEPARFEQPESCEELVPESRLTTFEETGLTLLGGPGGVYGTDYFADPTPEEQSGGITCIWGVDGNDGTTMVLSVAPMSPANRAQVVGDLVAQGLNERKAGDAVVYEVIGDTEGFPAIVNVLRSDSWMSVLSATGGQAAYDDAIAICDEMTELAYSS